MTRTNDLLKVFAVVIAAMLVVAAIVILMAGSAVANTDPVPGEWDIDITEEPESIRFTNAPGFLYAAEPSSCIIDNILRTENCPDVVHICTPGMSQAAYQRADDSAAPYNLRILGVVWASRATHCFQTARLAVPNPIAGEVVDAVAVPVAQPVATPTIMFTG